jgi:hypothetical protein
MEYLRRNSSLKKRKKSSELRESKIVSKKLSDSINDTGHKVNSKTNVYSNFIKNLVKAKKFKSLEKRGKKSSMDEQEKRKEKKLTYMEKYKKMNKPKESFYSTSKNPKINEILRKLKESEENGKVNVNNNTSIGKIDSNKINTFLGNKNKDSKYYENNIYESKVKNYVDELNQKIMKERTASEGNNNKKTRKIKKEKKDLENINDDENQDIYSDNEYDGIIYKKKSDDIQKQNEENYNNFNSQRKDQEKYINKINNINYIKFGFGSYKINDMIYIGKKKSNIKDYFPQNQTSFSILCKSLRKSSNLETNSKFKINKSKRKWKKISDDLFETERNDNVKMYNIVGYDNIKRRMTIYDILKKRKISIISEEPFITNKNKISRSIKKDKKDKQKDKEVETKEDEPEIKKYNDMVKYMIYSTVTNIKKNKQFNPKDFVISKIDSIELINKEKQIKDKKSNFSMSIEKKNDIEIIGYEKRNSNSISKLRNSLQKKENKNLSNFSSLTNKRDYKIDVINRVPIITENKGNINNNLLINKYTLPKRISIKKINKSTERRKVKSDLLFQSSSSSSDIEEEKKIEEKKAEKEINKNIKSINQFDELFHNYATNYNTNNKPRKISKNILDENSVNETKNNYLNKNNVLKNRTDSKNIYTDRETNESRALFKRRLKTSNKLVSEDLSTISKKEINKVKTDKAKIKKFKSKNNMAEVRQASTGKRKILNPNNKKYTDKNAKIRYFYKQRNINTDYINNSNIILQNTTVNHTTYNYYLNEGEKLSSSKKKRLIKYKK